MYIKFKLPFVGWWSIYTEEYRHCKGALFASSKITLFKWVCRIVLYNIQLWHIVSVVNYKGFLETNVHILILMSVYSVGNYENHMLGCFLYMC